MSGIFVDAFQQFGQAAGIEVEALDEGEGGGGVVRVLSVHDGMDGLCDL